MDKKSFEIMLLDVISCKWTHTLLTLIADDVIRPGEIQSRVEGLSIKVMNESLMRLVSYKMLTKDVFNEVPPRVEYRLTSLGKAALKLLNDAQLLKKEYEALEN
jgi:DNA-binding HxlR family transcriptional regulator